MIDLKKSRTLGFAWILALVVIVSSVSSFITWSLANRSSAKTLLQSPRLCSSNSLSAYERHNGAGGSMYVSVIFLNSSKSECSLFGFPVVTLYNARGFPMKNESQKNSPSFPSRPAIVSSGGVAGFVMQFPDGAVPGIDPRQGCRSAASMQVKLPHVKQYGQSFTTYFMINLAPCDGGGFEVTAIQRGDPLP